MPAVLIYATSIILLLGVLPMPYGYYTLLRIVACIVFIWASIESHKKNHTNLTWVFALCAVIFNPVIKVFFPKEVWMLIDAGAAILLLYFRNSLMDTKTNKF